MRVGQHIKYFKPETRADLMKKKRVYDKNEAVGLLKKGSHSKIAEVFILAGQSNMKGGGKMSELFEKYKKISPNFLFFEKGQFISPFEKEKFGPEIGVAHFLNEVYPKKTIVLCKVAKTGSNLYWDWNAANVYDSYYHRPCGELYVRLIHMISQLRSQLQKDGFSVSFSAMLWMQGESDSCQELTARSYETNLSMFIKEIRRTTGVPRLPFIIGQISSGIQKSDKFKILHAHNKKIREHQSSICRNHSNVFMIPTDDLSLENDLLHYDTPGQLELGKRFAEKYMDRY